jgi:hypothetical protein
VTPCKGGVIRAGGCLVLAALRGEFVSKFIFLQIHFRLME